MFIYPIGHAFFNLDLHLVALNISMFGQDLKGIADKRMAAIERSR